jgi:ferredoxin
MAAYSLCAAASAYCVGVGICVLVCSSSHLFRTAILMASLFFCAGSCLVPEDNNGQACAHLLKVLSN